MRERPNFIEGMLSVDDRGELRFCNDFNIKEANIKRFYVVSNHEPKFVRAWHAHKKEAKFVLVASGAALVAAVKIDNWETPSKKAKVHSFVLSDKKTRILKIPAGYANGFMALAPNTRIMFFSTATLEESKNDDYRYGAYYWNPWEIKQR